tara:strand:+ start:5419 stop:6795 length:1377 start_codon:yes stop_codon:yes gene_type:complete
MNNFFHLEKYSNNIALIDEQNLEISYKELAEKSDLIVKNIDIGNVFMLEFYPSINCICAYLGALRKGLICLLVDPLLSQKLKDNMVDTYNVSHVFDGHEWITKKNNECVSKYDVRLLMSTSGSTGSPKTVKLSESNLNSNASSICDYMGLNLNDIAITSLPLNYSYGLSILNSHLSIGAKIVLTNSPITSKNFWDLIESYGVTNLAGVPSSWRIIRKLYFERMKLPSLRIMSQAGGKLDKEEISWLNQIAIKTERKLFIMYGQTEATARISYVEPLYLSSKVGSIGKAIPYGSLELRDLNNKTITEPNIEGELIYKGPNVMIGYATQFSDLSINNKLTELRTGDLAYRDVDDFYWITGRIKRFIKIFGSRFNLDDIESHVRSLGYEAAVLGTDDNLLVGIEKLIENQDIDIVTNLYKSFKIHSSVIKVFSIDEIPRSNSGKVLYGKLKEKLTKLEISE